MCNEILEVQFGSGISSVLVATTKADSKAEGTQSKERGMQLIFTGGAWCNGWPNLLGTWDEFRQQPV